jgi:hypothetical protein
MSETRRSASAPVKGVVLYKHGVGYFERSVGVEGDARVDLKFKQKEMNDVLKSLTVIDQGGGAVTSISYDATTPLAKLLEEVSLSIPDRGSVSGLLGQVKGAALEIKAGGEVVRGKVVGLEESAERGPGESVITRLSLSLLDAEGRIRSHDLAKIEYISFLDEHIRKDIGYLLDTILASVRKDVKNITIFLAGKGKRDVSVAYVIESPVWKTSYRVVLGEGSDPAYLQGWALVDNTGDEDWDGVRLSLVSGLPVSFVHDLYSPRFVRRPIVEVRTDTGVAPVIPEEAEATMLGASLEDAAPMMEKAMSPRRAKMMAGPSMPCAAPAPRPMAQALRESAKVQTISREIGDFFEYAIENPVTVRRNQSALVPIVSGSFEGRKVLLYNQATRADNPMACIEMKNTTGLTLEGGPVTVMESSIYVGEAMMDTMKPGDERLVPFAVELGVRVNPEADTQDEGVRYVQVVRGSMTLRSTRIHRQTYRIRNKSKGVKVLYIEHPLRSDRELFDTPDPAEKTPSFYRFKVDLAGKDALSFTVKERSQETTCYSIQTFNKDTISFFLSQKYITPDAAKAFQEMADLQTRINEIQAKIGEAETDIGKIGQEQERLRQNIKSLSDSKEEEKLRSRYTKKLETQEDEIEKQQAKIAAWKKESEGLQATLEKRLRDFTFEKALA